MEDVEMRRKEGWKKKVRCSYEGAMEGQEGGKHDDDDWESERTETDEGGSHKALYLSAMISITTYKNIVFAMLTPPSPLRYHGA